VYRTARHLFGQYGNPILHAAHLKELAFIAQLLSVAGRKECAGCATLRS